MNKLYIGIDVGFTGAICIIEYDHAADKTVTTSFFDMPLINDQKGRSLVDARTLRDILQMAIALKDKAPIAGVLIEQVGAMPKQGVTSMFRFGQALGTVEAVVALAGVPYAHILPQKWKSKMSVNGEKDYARTQAIARFPDLSDVLKLNKHSGRADAFFIALYAALHSKGVFNG